MNYDVVIPVTHKNIQNLKFTVRGIKRYIQPNKIILVGSSKLEASGDNMQCHYVDEDLMYENLNYNLLREAICRRDSLAGKRTGWYLQQFLKMSYARVCSKEYYLVWDADTVPVRKIDICNPDGNPYFDVKEEYHKPYFTTLNRLFDGQYQKVYPYSFISEHMFINAYFMRQMLNDIEFNQSLEGKYFWEKIISAVCCIDLLRSGFSEFETYGNYVCKKWPGVYEIRKLKSYRQSVRNFSMEVSEEMLQEFAKEYDIVTCEMY